VPKTRDPARVAADIAEDLLFPNAPEIDASAVVPRRYLDALAEVGLYGLYAPTGSGGFDADPVTAGRVVEALGGASLTTAFVWIQHHSVVRAIAGAAPAMRDGWLGPLGAGQVRAGIAYAALRRPGPPAAVARPAGDGWVIDGHAPWVTGWSRIDVLLAGARAGADVVWALLDAAAAPTCTVEPVHLDALQASATVAMQWTGHAVAPERTVAVEPFTEWQRRDAHGRQLNGYLALGVAARCARLLGPSGLDASVAAARLALDAATPETVVTARAESSLLAVRAAAALVAAGGGRGMESGSHAARLMREAMFLLVFGQTRDIRAAQLAALGATPGREDPA
jgi:alkylation response protein AidB-like acyl-CoA dehydrogenase